MRSSFIKMALMVALLVGVSDAVAAVVPPIVAPTKTMRLLRVEQSSTLWYFNGEHPANYDIEVTLTARGTGVTGTFRWEVIGGTGLVDLENNTDLMTKTNDNTIRLRSTGASAPAATVTADVQVRLTFNGADTVDYSTAVFAPHRLIPLGTVHNADPTWGYESHVSYRIRDQFTRTLPLNVELNERFTTVQVADFEGMDWRRGPEGGTTVNPNSWLDRIQGELSTHTPTPQNPPTPPDPLGGVLVSHWDGEWNIGSVTIGSGRRVQTNRWQKNQDHALHTIINSPVP